VFHLLCNSGIDRFLVSIQKTEGLALYSLLELLVSGLLLALQVLQVSQARQAESFQAL
jgi:hypothetical protein